MILRLLVLDDVLLTTRWLEQVGIELDVTELEFEEIFRDGHYVISPRGCDLARQADDYDAVIIGNNLGTGLRYAREIPDSMKAHTLIVWNERRPGQEAAYVSFGFEHFENRKEKIAWLQRQAEEMMTRAEG